MFASRADPHQFVERFEQLVSFAPHVRDVFALVFRRDFAQLDQLFGFRVKRRRINQRRADAERPGFHFFPHQLAHFVELLRRRPLYLRIPLRIRESSSHRGMTRHCSEMPRFSRYCRYSASVFHLMSYLMSVLLADHVLAHTIVQRPHRFAFAHDLRRDALSNFAL